MTERRRVLVVDPDGAVADLLEAVGSVRVGDGRVASERLAAASADCVVCTDGIASVPEAVGAIRETAPGVPIVVVAVDGSERLAADALGAGATDYVPADDPAAVRDRVARASNRVATGGSVSSGNPTVGTALTDDETPVPLAAVAGSLSEVLVTIDTDSEIQYVNGAVTDVFGYDPGELVGKSLTVLLPERFHDAHHAGVATHLETGERALDWSSVELSGQHAEGHEIDLEVSFGKFVVEGQRYFTGLIRDVSSIVDRERTLSNLYAASRELLLATTPAEIAETAVEAAVDALDLPRTGVYRHDPDREALVPVALSPAGREQFGEPILPAGESLAYETFQAGETRLFDAVHERPGTYKPDTAVRTEVQIPIGEDYLLLSGSTDEREFEDYQLDLAELLATSAEAALQRAEHEAELRRYETIFRTIDERVCVVDGDGDFRLVTDSMCSFLGVAESTLTGQSAMAFLPTEAAERLQTRLSRLSAGQSVTVEIDVLDDDGECHPCEVDVTVLPPEARLEGYLAAVHDISDRRAVESALAAQRDRFEELFANVPDPVVEARLVDGTPIVRSVNEAFEETFGYPAEAVIEKSLNEFVLPPDGDADAGDLDRRAAAGELVTAELRRETTGGIRDFLFRGIPVAETDEGTLAFGIYTDITDQRLRERRLGVLNRVFRHNIRNEMNVVQGRAEHLINADDPDVDVHAGAIARTADSVIALAEGIRTAERALDREDAPHRPLADVLVETVASYRDREGLAMSTEFDDDLPPVDVRLGVVIEELLDNAVEHSDRDRPVVSVTARQTDGAVRVTVADDGPGLPAVERAVIEARDETPLEHGTGVGLWLVNWLVTALGGELDVADDDPRGTVVTMSFPVSALPEG